MAQIGGYRGATTIGRAVNVFWTGFCILVFTACWDVVPPSNGDGGTGGSEPPICGQAVPEIGDIVDEELGVAIGTVNGDCTIFEDEVLGCEGPDLLDEVYFTALRDGPMTVDLFWEHASSDLDLAVFRLPPSCEILAVSTNRAGTDETITLNLDNGTEVVVVILAVDTNGSPETYVLE